MNSAQYERDTSSTTCSPPITLLPVLAWAAGLALLLTIIGGLLHGKIGVEKTLTHLTFPIQTSWLLLSGCTLYRLKQLLCREAQVRPVLGLLLLWCIYTVAGTPPLGDACYLFLETRETVYTPESDPPLDLLVVLGGSTSQGPYRAESSQSGDRVLLAAQLYLQGRTKSLVTTGSAILHENSPAEQTREIWKGLGIPSNAIEALPGANTYAEMQALKQLLERTAEEAAGSSAQAPRVGLLTSAWHLPRAMRIARAAGLSQLIPVAADHEQRQPPLYWEYFPSANNFSRLERCQREFLAKLVSR